MGRKLGEKWDAAVDFIVKYGARKSTSEWLALLVMEKLLPPDSRTTDIYRACCRRLEKPSDYIYEVKPRDPMRKLERQMARDALKKRMKVTVTPTPPEEQRRTTLEARLLNILTEVEKLCEENRTLKVEVDVLRTANKDMGDTLRKLKNFV